jgi:arabinofuranosyltransferase
MMDYFLTKVSFSKSFKNLALFFSTISLVLLVIAEFLRWRYWDVDDALIVFRLVRNLLTGAGWVYNIGEIHNSSTSVLNPLLIFLLTYLTGDILLAAHLLGAIAIGACGVFTFLLLKEAPFWWRVFAAHLVVYNQASNLTWGLETNLFSAVLLLLVLIQNRWTLSWFLIGVLILIRPDAQLLIPIRLIINWFADRPQKWSRVLVIFFPLLPCYLYSLITFGQLFPDTLYNKIWQGSSGFWGIGWVYYHELKRHVAESAIYLILCYSIAILGAPLIWINKNPIYLLVIYSISQNVAYSILNVPGYSWYFVNSDVCAIISAFYIFPKLTKFLFGWGWLVELFKPNLIVPLLLLFFSISTLTNINNYKQINSRTVSYRLATEYIKSLKPTIKTLGVLEVGTFGFFAPDIKIVDFIGLTTPNPEYLTGKNNNHFFNNAPDALVLHSPKWTMERAIAWDERFNKYYKLHFFLDEVHTPVKIYVRR